MTAPPAGALEACLALLEKATPGEAVGRMRKDDSVYVSIGDRTKGAHAKGDVMLPYDDVAVMVAAVNLLRTHGPALLAALRLREGSQAAVSMLRESAKQHRLAGDAGHARHCDGIADDLARILEEGE